MDKHEMKARIEAQLEEWKGTLDTMWAKADTSTGDSKAEYLDSVMESRRQLDGLKIEAAKVWDAADDLWESAGPELDLKWEKWKLSTKQAWDKLTD